VKNRMMFNLFTLAVFCIIVSCNTTLPTDSKAPRAEITYPADNSEFPFGTEVTVIAEATDNEEVKGVRFYVNDKFIHVDETEPYEYEWSTTNPRDIEHTIYAKAYDTSDNQKISDEISVTVLGDNSDTFDWCDVPAGEYTWGEDDEIQNLDYDYQIMKYEVTNQQYVYFLQEAYAYGEITVSSSVEGYYPGDTNYDAGNYELYDLNGAYNRIFLNNDNFIIETGYEEHPVVEVTWFGAWAFAQYYDLRLPTEQEWEKAARGNTGYKYPWGDEISGDRANYRDSGDPWDEGTSPIGYYNGHNGTTDSPSPYGVYDMCGNVFDWTDSWVSYNSLHRVLRGGYWYNNSAHYQLSSWARYYDYPTISYHCQSFRCAVTP
jgi:formylglycine-generating enzyme required for sulfatase activity